MMKPTTTETGTQSIAEALPVLAALGTIIAFGIVVKLFYSTKKKKVLLVDPKVKYALPLIEKQILSHDTRLYRFGLPSSEHVLGLPIGQHVHLSANVNGEIVIRAYTPVTSDDDYGHMDLVVKVYFKNVHPKFPEGGKMSQYLESLKIGETIDVRGPSGRLVYNGKGKFSIKLLRKEPPVEYSLAKAVMIAGGTGITPMLQLIRAIVKDPLDKTQVSLLYANQTEKDILLREELDEVAKNHPDQVKVWYTVDTGSEGWKYSTGFVNDQMIAEHMLPPSPDTIVLMCGPPPMINYACTPNLDKLGYETKLRFAY
ncbi:NADH-cytochrome b5 reductase 2 isoform X1 [Copidosoma floridanum]|uniref:NADH-cytochrome b5 reductase 2 isoform X1 n=1 Tax=Copidosoma floridanum TaxID=29053 RepID=UPI0006C9B369|nr:NADH-cytochrome b5 reductase 2 isoform X1 [Copidosoma floridanum]